MSQHKKLKLKSLHFQMSWVTWSFSLLKKLKQMVTTKEEEEEHVMHPKEAEDDDIEDSDSDFDPIGFGIEERIRQVQSWFFFQLQKWFT